MHRITFEAIQTSAGFSLSSVVGRLLPFDESIEAETSRFEFTDNLNIRLSAYMVDGPLPTGAAERLGVTMSGVTSDPSKVSCPAYKQGGVCGSCRACWDKKEAVVFYPRH